MGRCNTSGLAGKVLLPHCSLPQRCPQKTEVNEIVCVQNCEQYSLLFTMCGGDSGLSYEYTLTPVPEGKTINDQKQGSLAKKQVDGTLEVAIEYANTYVSHECPLTCIHHKRCTQQPTGQDDPSY